MKKTLINIGLTAGGIFILYKLFKKDDVVPMKKPLPQDNPQPIGDDNFSNFSGFLKKSKRPKNNTQGQRSVNTRCATNLERLSMLYPNADQYNAELGKAYQREGANFQSWAQAQAKPCFVVGIDQGGLLSGGINFSGEDFTFQGAGDF